MDEKRKAIDDILNEVKASEGSTSDDFSIDDILREYKKESIAEHFVEKEPEPRIEEIKIPTQEETSTVKDRIEGYFNENKPIVKEDEPVILPKEEPVIEQKAQEIKSFFDNKKVNDFFSDFYEEKKEPAPNSLKNEPVAVESEEEEIEEEPEEVEEIKPFKGFMGKLLNESDDGEEPIFSHEEKQFEEIDEFETLDDADSINSDLSSQKKEALFKIVIGALAASLLMTLHFLAQFNKLPAFIMPNESPFSFGVASVGLTLTVISCGFKTFLYGLKSLIVLKPTNDSLPALAMLASFVQALFMTMGAMNFQNTAILMYGGVASFAFLLTLFGKYLHIVATYKNFQIVSSDKKKHTLTMLSQSEMPQGVQIPVNEGCAVVEANFFSGFLEKSFSDNPSQDISKKTVPFVVAGILAIVVISVVKGTVSSLPMQIAAVSAVCASFISELAFVLPYFLETAKVRKFGCAINGFTCAKQYSNIIGLAVKDIEILKPSNTSITGMKMLGKAEIYDTVIKSASLFKAVEGPLYGAFLQVLDGKEELLKDVSDITIHEGRGLTGVIDGERIFVGSTEFLKSCGIRIPAEDYEQRLARGNKTVVLFAEKGALTGVFVTSYGIGNSTYSAISRLENEGIGLMVYTDDYSITGEFLEKRLKTKHLELMVFGSETAPKLKDVLKPRERASSSIVSVNGLTGIEAALRVARRLRRTVNACIVLKTVSIFIGLAVSGFMVFNSSDMTPLQIMGYSSLWTVLSFITAILGL